MTKLNLFAPAFLLSILTGIAGMLLKILHLQSGQLFLVLTGIFTLLYIIIALSEIYRSDSTLMNEKIMWTIGFVVFSTIAGLLYLLIGRPRMKRESKILNPARP